MKASPGELEAGLTSLEAVQVGGSWHVLASEFRMKVLAYILRLVIPFQLAGLWIRLNFLRIWIQLLLKCGSGFGSKFKNFIKKYLIKSFL